MKVEIRLVCDDEVVTAHTADVERHPSGLTVEYIDITELIEKYKKAAGHLAKVQLLREQQYLISARPKTKPIKPAPRRNRIR